MEDRECVCGARGRCREKGVLVGAMKVRNSELSDNNVSTCVCEGS